MACRKLIGRALNPWRSKSSGIFSRRSPLNSKRRREALMLISQMETELTQTEFCGADISFCACRPRRRLFFAHQIRTWVSMRRFIYNSKRFGNIGRQWIVEIGMHLDEIFPHAGLACECGLGEGHQPRLRLSRLGDNDFCAGGDLFHEAGKVGFGGMDINGLHRTKLSLVYYISESRATRRRRPAILEVSPFMAKRIMIAVVGATSKIA